MGSMATLSIGSYDFVSYKNTFGDLLTLFYEGDRKTLSEEIDEKIHTKYFFSTTVSHAKKCLDLLGYTLNKAREVFESNKLEKIEFLRKYDMGGSYEFSIDDMEMEFTFDNWCCAAWHYARVLSKDEFSSECIYTELERQRLKQHTVSERIVLDSLPFDKNGTFFGIQNESWEIFRIILEAFDEDQEICLDYTNLFEGGWCEVIPDEESYDIQKIVVLTEGKYDAFVISQSMRLLYPYMSKFYSFMDFSSVNVQGSTSFLTHYLKAFIGAKIENKIIALYDNDAAGLSEIKSLESVVLPHNVRLMHLPNLTLCDSYPTIGPTDNENANINGRACSIELFLGKDILTVEEKLIPIMWTGYIDKVKAYQGEIMSKGDIQKKFKGKLQEAEEKGVQYLDDWCELDILLNSIFGAFF